MGGEIRVSEGAVASSARMLRQELSDYEAFSLSRLGGRIPDAAAAEHDGRITSLMKAALTSFAGVVEADALSVGVLGDALSATDATVASMIRAR